VLSSRLQRLRSDLQGSVAGALSEFWDELARRGTPIIEDGAGGNAWVTFVWRDDGSAQNVAVIQDWGADGIREHHMARLPGSDVWYLTRSMRPDTRTTYQLSPSASADPEQAAPYQLDPLNPNIYAASRSEIGSDIRFSVLELPEAPALPWRQAGATPRGLVTLHTPLGDQRRLWVYRPPIDPAIELPALVVFDGERYKELMKLPEMLDFLIYRGRIPPVAALMVDNRDRSELECRPDFETYMVQHVMPWFRAAYPISADPGRTTLIGSSLGGLAAGYCAFTHPRIWGRVVAQSGWFRWRPEGDGEHHWLARQMAAAPQVPVQFWLQVGNLETAKMSDGGPSQLAANEFTRDTLPGKGYWVSYREYSGGHDTTSLEYPLAQALSEVLQG
jgi:enterochelin esterase family protein